jgi:hypothetical protein
MGISLYGPAVAHPLEARRLHRRTLMREWNPDWRVASPVLGAVRDLIPAQATRRHAGGSVLANGIWIALALALCIKCWVYPGYRSVYPVYTWASGTWWQDKPLYTTAADSHNYRYSPTFAVAFTPFARLPEQVGSSLWCLLNVGVLFLSLRAMAGYALPRVRAEHRDAGFMALALLGSVSGLWSSQANSLIIAMTLLAGVALLRQRWWLAALLLTVSVYIKVWPLAVALLLAVCWPRPLIWRMAVLMVALAAIPFLTRPPSTVIWQYHQWWAKLTESQVHDRGPLYPGFWTLGERLGMVFSDGAQRLIQAASALLVFVGCLWQRRRLLKDEPGRLLMGVISLWASWQLLFGPGTERITYSLIAP